MPKKSSVTCVKPSDPPFLKKLKERVGYKEGPTVDTKREGLPADGVAVDPDDEKPVVVVLKAGDLTAEEAEKYHEKEEDNGPADGRIIFKKPTKRTDSTSSAGGQAKRLKEADKSRHGQVSSVKDNRLLSFVGNEDEDED